ncbi:hypothetical protein ODY46_03735 [Aerococcus sp. CDC-944-U94]|uniref:hypothetical protein n=1 Tax=Aerococcus urinae (strain CCUG 59500 / ACS-120-V-Col10a) TaxID=2976812 RepID=UPI00227AFF9D|nr:hypothetical protein [Aerococcus sp. Group 1]MCY3054840.1 hypothetical protein [Aerococcus sp. Group 1]MCY3056570.1 hypothetical protein [Aerococcus sp. Group 1]
MMTYQNSRTGKIKNAHPLLVSCMHRKHDLCVYWKVGRGNLIKLQIHRIIEAEYDFGRRDKALLCPNCQEQLGSLSEHKGRPCYFLHRGQTQTKRLENYKY